MLTFSSLTSYLHNFLSLFPTSPHPQQTTPQLPISEPLFISRTHSMGFTPPCLASAPSICKTLSSLHQGCVTSPDTLTVFSPKDPCTYPCTVSANCSSVSSLYSFTLSVPCWLDLLCRFCLSGFYSFFKLSAFPLPHHPRQSPLSRLAFFS